MCSSGWPRTRLVDQAGFELAEIQLPLLKGIVLSCPVTGMCLMVTVSAYSSPCEIITTICMQMRPGRLQGMAEEVFITDMRERAARDIWKGPDWMWPARQMRPWGVGGAKEEEKRRPRGKENQESEDQEARRTKRTKRTSRAERLSYTGKRSWRKEREAQGQERFRVGVRSTERSQDSVAGAWGAERAWWPASALIC